jgi:SAM-dependent methyltransferase
VSGEEQRKASEREFHDHRYADETRAGVDKYYAVIRASYEDFRSSVRVVAPGADLLEYGCGAEPHAVVVGGEAASVRGFDISPVAVEQAQTAAREAGLADAEFRVMDGEALDYPDDSFDVVYGSAVIHHLDLDRAFAEIVRVLRPGGRAIFLEPLGHNPAINLYRRRTPALRTPDEHPLTDGDLKLARSFFAATDYRFYHLFSLAAVPFRDTRAFDRLLSGLDAVDRTLFRVVPPARRLAWYAVLELERPIKSRAEPER